MHSLRGLPDVIDIRNCRPDRRHRAAAARRASRPTARVRVFQRCFDAGLLIRTTGDIIALSPPLIVENGHVDRIVETLTTAIRAEAA